MALSPLMLILALTVCMEMVLTRIDRFDGWAKPLQ